MVDDAQLLRRYADENSEAAFAELVRRYLNLVYSAAMRQVGGDAHRAQDVAQVVFTTLARKASSLTHHPVLAGWLYTATQHAAAKAMRTEWRRQAREQEAHAMQEVLSSPTPEIDWTRIRPVLDHAMGELAEPDREAVLLRFFAKRPFSEIGRALGLTEDAARMRVERALGKLHSLLSRRGVTSTTSALGLILANEAAAVAPASLITVLTRGALAGAGAVGEASTLAAKFSAATRTPIGAAASLGLVILLGTLGYQVFSDGGDAGKEISKNPNAVPSARSSVTTAASTATPSTPRGLARTAPQPGLRADNAANAAQDWLAKGRSYENAKQYDRALEAYTAAIGLDPKLYDAYFVRAGLYASHLPTAERDYSKAAADLTTALEIRPREYSARFNRALSYRQLRELDKAIADYTTIIEGDTDFSHNVESRDHLLAQTREYRGQIFLENTQDYRAAITDFDEALRLDPKIDMALYRRALAHQALKEYAAAETDFSAANQQQPNYPNLLAGWAWQLATAPDAKDRDAEAALKLATRANEIFKYRVADHLDALAAAYAENGRFDEAVATQQKALASIASYQVKLRPAMERRLLLYQARRPFREE